MGWRKSNFGQLPFAILKSIKEMSTFWQVIFFTQRFSEMMAQSTSSCETFLGNRQMVSQCAVSAGQYSASITFSGQLWHCAERSLLNSGKLSLFSLKRFPVVL
tara:strand:+ start:196 stop:504 length:309 start_codon:yes stop_codon:yes gene_type:complete